MYVKIIAILFRYVFRCILTQNMNIVVVTIIPPVCSSHGTITV